jgi:hypothetical protein
MLKINVLGLANLHTIRLSASEVCTVCGFSERTFFHRIKSGKIRASHDEQNRIRDGRPRIYVAADDLAYYFGIRDEAQARARMGLPAIVEEKPEPEDDRKIFADVGRTSTDVPTVGRSSPDVPVRDRQGFTDDPADNLARWNAGEIADSAGNTVNGNERWPSKGIQTLLGPIEPMPRVRPDTTVHMDPALVGDVTAAPNPVDSDAFNELWHPGTADRKAQMYQQCGVRQPSEQQRKQAVDRAAIAAAFRQGWSR